MKLLTEELKKEFEKFPLYSQDGKGKETKVICKFFNPTGAGTWLVTEGSTIDGEDWEFFGFAHITDGEFGYFTLKELESIRLPFGMTIERDVNFKTGTPIVEALESNGFEVPSWLLKDEEEEGEE